jgi:uncharacterized cupredoxin-like copper-binding protein
MHRFLWIPILASALLVMPLGAQDKHVGHSGHTHSVKKTAYGQPGDRSKISRTIVVGMSDAMRYSPDRIEVKRGETIRFIAKNTGKVEHELVLGTAKDLKAHAEAMRKDPGMAHGAEPNAVDVDPGKQGELIWQFTRAGTFQFGCLVPGHFEAGMLGTLVVR